MTVATCSLVTVKKLLITTTNNDIVDRRTNFPPQNMSHENPQKSEEQSNKRTLVTQTVTDCVRRILDSASIKLVL